MPLHPEQDGYFSGFVTGAAVESTYQFRLDGGAELFPDPASRFQPQGVHGPSQVVDPSTFQWTDAAWRGIKAANQVLYELHVGTFTTAGTLAAAERELQSLATLGITCIELMPVGEFAGRFGWGYDCVDLFAPTHLYGTPEDLRRFIDTAHSLGVAVILDVVYNHLGPDGNYLEEFSDHYFTAKHRNDWGASLNFDDVGSEHVRAFFVTNARYWITEFHFDGFRFDATQAILDDSPRHVLAEIAAAAREAAGTRSIYLIGENEPQHTKIARPEPSGGYGFDALWNDDFHHSATVSLIGRNEAYFTDYLGRPQEFISTAKYGYLYQGQFYKWQRKRRGTPGLDLPPTAMVNYIQNHDQIANYGHGLRCNQLSSIAQFRAMTALLLLSPQTPLLFQGQEFASTSPFHYFADHIEEIHQMICRGRAKEMSQFPSVGTPDMLDCLRDPGMEETFQRCKLNPDERHHGVHAQLYLMHHDLLALRRNEPVFRRVQQRGDLDGAVLGHDAFVLRYFGRDDESQSGDDRLLVVNFGTDLHLPIVPEPLLAPPQGQRWETLWSSEDPHYGGSGSPPLETRREDWRMPGENWRLPGRSAVLLKPVPISPEDFQAEQRMAEHRETEKDTHQ